MIAHKIRGIWGDLDGFPVTSTICNIEDTIMDRGEESLEKYKDHVFVFDDELVNCRKCLEGEK